MISHKKITLIKVIHEAERGWPADIVCDSSQNFRESSEMLVQLERHPLFAPIKSFLTFFSSGECRFEDVANDLNIFISEYEKQQEELSRVIDPELQEYIETLAYYVFNFFLENSKLAFKALEFTFNDTSNPLCLPQMEPFAAALKEAGAGQLEAFKRRPNFPKSVTDVLEQWLGLHRQFPYPNPDDKRQLCEITGISLKQLNDWFINARRRKLNPE